MKFKKWVEYTLFIINTVCAMLLVGIVDIELCLETLIILGALITVFGVNSWLLSKYGKCFK